MSKEFICPTCKRPTHPTDNEIIEYLVKEKDRYRDILGERTKELERTRKALEIALDAINRTKDWYPTAKIMKEALDKITALEQKEVK